MNCRGALSAPYMLCFDFDFLRLLWYKVPEFSVPRGVSVECVSYVTMRGADAFKDDEHDGLQVVC